MTDDIRTCPECGSDEIYFAEGVHNGALPGFFLQYQPVKLYVCGRCGYLRKFIPEDLLPRIRKKWHLLSPEKRKNDHNSE